MRADERYEHTRNSNPISGSCCRPFCAQRTRGNKALTQVHSEVCVKKRASVRESVWESAAQVPHATLRSERKVGSSCVPVARVLWRRRRRGTTCCGDSCCSTRRPQAAPPPRPGSGSSSRSNLTSAPFTSESRGRHASRQSRGAESEGVRERESECSLGCRGGRIGADWGGGGGGSGGGGRGRSVNGICRRCGRSLWSSSGQRVLHTAHNVRAMPKEIWRRSLTSIGFVAMNLDTSTTLIRLPE